MNEFKIRNSLLVGADTGSASAIIQADSTTQGLLPPRMTTTQRDAIGSPATGLTIFNTTTNALNSYNGSSWDAATFVERNSANDYKNGSIATSVASNALTITLVTDSGSNATATDIITIGFRSSTAGTGTVTTRTVTGALSTVVSSGSTLGHVSAVESPIYIYAIDNAGTVELAYSTNPRWDDGSLVSTTAEGGAGAADSRDVLYSTTARSNVAIRLLGRVRSTQTTAGTWATAMSEVSNIPIKDKIGQHEITVSNGAGRGSTNTHIRRIETARSSSGTAISVTHSSTDGTSFTINEDGLYAMNYTDTNTAGSCRLGISRNSTQLTTDITNLNEVDRLVFATAVSTEWGTVSTTRWLNKGDIIRPHDNNTANSVNEGVKFAITKVG